jgi:hypothetical protein
MERLKLETIENIIGVEKITIEAFEKYGECASLDKCILMGMEELKQYRIAEEQGMLMRLPVPKGATVYRLGYTLDCKFDYQCPLHEDELNACVMGIACENEEKVWKVKEEHFHWKMLKSVGSTIFLTKEEAEQALERM